MVKNLLLVILSIYAYAVTAQTTSVLFLGNSYTGTNALVTKFSELSLAAGDTVYTDSNTPGGYTLEGHSANSTSIAKIYERNWDFVVLQEQSQRPSFHPNQVANEVYPFAEILCDTIRANYECTEPVFYMTWGRRSGDQQNCQFYTPVCTFEGMSTRLRQSYLEMAEDNDARVAPCGAAWSRLDIADTTFFAGLYNSDGSHPSTYGQYLNACVFYATIFKKSPVGIPYYANISQVDAETLQALAHEIVIDSLDNWNVDVAWPVAEISINQDSPLNFEFLQTSSGATSHYWDLGDGTTSVDSSIIHAYGNLGTTYDVLYVASDDCGRSDSIWTSVLTGNISVGEPEIELSIKTLSKGEYELISTHIPVSATLTDLAGQTVGRLTAGSVIRIDLRDRPEGVFLLSLNFANGERQVLKLTR